MPSFKKEKKILNVFFILTEIMNFFFNDDINFLFFILKQNIFLEYLNLRITLYHQIHINTSLINNINTST